MRHVIFILILCLLLGCAKKATPGAAASGAGKTLAGDWYGAGSDDMADLQLATDGTFILMAGNRFAAAALEGTYQQTADHLILNSRPAGSKDGYMPVNYQYRWIGPTTIGLRMELDPVKESVLELRGPGPATASVTSLAGGGTVSGANDPRVQATVCFSNMKMLATGALMYQTDWDGTLPAAGVWSNALMPYARNITVFSCPAVAAAKKEGGYAMDSNLSGAAMKSILKPEATTLFFESTAEWINASDPQTSILRSPRHGGTIGIAYADGHVKGR